MKNQLNILFQGLLGSLRDLAPVILVIAFFQLAVVQQPIPDLGGLLAGTALVVVGLTLFVRGLEMGLFPIGEAMAYAFARKGSLAWLLVFAFALGFGTTVAEPALIAVANEAARVASDSKLIAAGDAARHDYALGLRITVALVTALGVGLASSIKGRNPLVDGFGLIAFASLTPMIFVMIYGTLVL